jgi:hypothetical protein
MHIFWGKKKAFEKKKKGTPDDEFVSGDVGPSSS